MTKGRRWLLNAQARSRGGRRGSMFGVFPARLPAGGKHERRSPSRHERSLAVADLARHPTTGRTVGVPHGDHLGKVEN